MKTVLAALLIALALTTGGCWDSHELDNLSIVMGIGLDAGQGGEAQEGGAQSAEAASAQPVIFTVQIGDIVGANAESAAGSDFFLLEKETDSILSTINYLKYESSRRLFLHHNQLILFGEELAQGGLLQFIDFFMRDFQTRKEVWLFLSEGTAKELLAAKLPQEKISSIGIMNMTGSDEHIYDYIGVNLIDFTSKLLDKTTAPIMPVLSLQHENDVNSIRISGLGVFEGDKLVDVLDADEIRGFLWTVAGIDAGVVRVESHEGSAALRVEGCSHKIVPLIRADGGVDFQVRLYIRLSLDELNGFDGKDINEIYSIAEGLVAGEIDRLMQNTLAHAKELGTDIYGFGSKTHSAHPKKWAQMEGNWDEIFKNVNIDAEIKVSIADTGRLLEALTSLVELPYSKEVSSDA